MVWLVVFLPSRSNWLRKPVGVHLPNDNAHTGIFLRQVGVTFLSWAGHADPLAKLVSVVAYLTGSICQDWVCACPFQCLGLTDHRDRP